MKPRTSLIFVLLVSFLGGCAVRPAYFGRDATLIDGSGRRSCWHGSVLSSPYVAAAMRRLDRPAPSEPAAYAGTMTLRAADVVMVSTFSVFEGGSAYFHYDWNAGVERALALSGQATRYFPEALDVIVTCAVGVCGVESKPLQILADGSVLLKSKKVHDEAVVKRLKLESSRE
jgi:hypothetical protein